MRNMLHQDNKLYNAFAITNSFTKKETLNEYFKVCKCSKSSFQIKYVLSSSIVGTLSHCAKRETDGSLKGGFFKVHIFWEGHKILQNLHLTFDLHYIGRK